MFPSCAGNATISTPGGAEALEPSAVISRRRTPSSANNLGFAPNRPGINDCTSGLRAWHLPYRELRIVRDGRAHSDDNNIDQRAQAMQVINTCRTVDILRMASRGRYPAIQ